MPDSVAKNSSFKLQNSFEDRVAQHTKVTEAHPNKIPVIVERANSANVPEIDKNKYLVPGDLTVAQFLCLIRKRIKLSNDQALFIYVDGTLPASSAMFSALHEEHMDKDGFLYVVYTGESSFGSSCVGFQDRLIAFQLMSQIALGFPIFAVAIDEKRGEILAGGGGGPSKSGVINGIEILNFSAGKLAKVSSYSTGSDAIMNIDIGVSKVACGVNEYCWVLSRSGQQDEAFIQEHIVQTDFANMTGYQKSVRISQDERLLLTGGSDGKARLWHLQNMQQLDTFGQFDTELVSVDFSNDSSRVAVTAAEGCHISPLDKNDSDLTAFISPKTGFNFRCAKFKVLANLCECFITVENAKDKKASLITIWDISSWSVVRRRRVPTKKPITALAICSRMDLIVLGNSEGAIIILDSLFCKIRTIPRAHDFAVTSIAANESLDWIVSASADGTVLLTNVSSCQSESFENSITCIASLVLPIILVCLHFRFS